VRRIEIIGETARRVSEETRERYPQIPWRQMTGMRNLVIHEYDEWMLSRFGRQFETRFRHL